ncbi:hypothetical protein EAG_10231 [Camponotus floridanus]|uniref:Uncharacterized protein n=1 Tax=Camponotus floridanus TaxID=104421 RepID=E2B091_CAMFO|nr:hypothetical protein EAG_10231 [Camponotus floridanus]
MYYVERSSSSSGGIRIGRHVNNYVPSRDKTPSFENKYDDISSERRAVRILGRRYALTAKEFKFLEIGINVGPLRLPCHRRSSGKGTDIISRNVEGTLRATSRYSKSPSERLSRHLQFYKHWTANIASSYN